MDRRTLRTRQRRSLKALMRDHGLSPTIFSEMLIAGFPVLRSVTVKRPHGGLRSGPRASPKTTRPRAYAAHSVEGIHARHSLNRDIAVSLTNPRKSTGLGYRHRAKINSVPR